MISGDGVFTESTVIRLKVLGTGLEQMYTRPGETAMTNDVRNRRKQAVTRHSALLSYFFTFKRKFRPNTSSIHLTVFIPHPTSSHIHAPNPPALPLHVLPI
jgi:hypothetical protein